MATGIFLFESAPPPLAVATRPAAAAGPTFRGLLDGCLAGEEMEEEKSLAGDAGVTAPAVLAGALPPVPMDLAADIEAQPEEACSEDTPPHGAAAGPSETAAHIQDIADHPGQALAPQPAGGLPAAEINPGRTAADADPFCTDPAPEPPGGVEARGQAADPPDASAPPQTAPTAAAPNRPERGSARRRELRLDASAPAPSLAAPNPPEPTAGPQPAPDRPAGFQVPERPVAVSAGAAAAPAAQPAFHARLHDQAAPEASPETSAPAERRSAPEIREMDRTPATTHRDPLFAGGERTSNAFTPEPSPAAAIPAYTAPQVRGTGDSARHQTPEAPAIVEPPEIPAPPRGPVRELAVRLAGDDRSVEIRMAERAGEIRVSVHAADGELRSALQDGLPELVHGLENRGFAAQAWRSGDSPARGDGGELPPDYPPSGGSHPGAQQDGRERRRAPQTAWADEMARGMEPDPERSAENEQHD